MWCQVLNIGAVILAAGNSKDVEPMILPCNGKTALDGVIDSLEAANVKERVIVLGGEIDSVVDAIRPKLGKVKIALNVTPELGETSSFQTGLIVLQNLDAVLLVSGSERFVNPLTFASMIQALERNPTALIVSASVQTGNLALFRSPLFSEILSLNSSESVANFIQTHTEVLVTI